ncbi:hypothetical protein EMCRGX_G023561 [Ephydatia muelleri]
MLRRRQETTSSTTTATLTQQTSWYPTGLKVTGLAVATDNDGLVLKGGSEASHSNKCQYGWYRMPSVSMETALL